MPGGQTPGGLGDDPALLGRACDDLDNGLLQVVHADEMALVPGGPEGALIHQVLQIGAGEAAGGFCQRVQIHVLGQRFAAGVYAQDLLPAFHVRVARSKRPGRSSAGSRISCRLVAAMTITPEFPEKPSISTSS